MTDTIEQETTETAGKTKPALNLTFLSHGTLECRDLQRTRRFYSEFLGFETVATSKLSFWSRLGGEHVYVCVQSSGDPHKMPFLNHNGIDVASDADVDESYRVVLRDAEKWDITGITEPIVQHGSYSFYFYDMDGNCWEIGSNPKGGYGWMFERGDQTGRGHLDKNFVRPVS